MMPEAIRCGEIWSGWDSAQTCPTSRRVPEGTRVCQVWHVLGSNAPGYSLHTSPFPLTAFLKSYLKRFLRHSRVEQKQIEGLTGNLGGHIVLNHGIQAIIPPLCFNSEWKR